MRHTTAHEAIDNTLDKLLHTFNTLLHIRQATTRYDKLDKLLHTLNKSLHMRQATVGLCGRWL